MRFSNNNSNKQTDSLMLPRPRSSYYHHSPTIQSVWSTWTSTSPASNEGQSLQKDETPRPLEDNGQRDEREQSKSYHNNDFRTAGPFDLEKQENYGFTMDLDDDDCTTTTTTLPRTEAADTHLSPQPPESRYRGRQQHQKASFSCIFARQTFDAKKCAIRYPARYLTFLGLGDPHKAIGNQGSEKGRFGLLVVYRIFTALFLLTSVFHVLRFCMIFLLGYTEMSRTDITTNIGFISWQIQCFYMAWHCVFTLFRPPRRRPPAGFEGLTLARIVMGFQTRLTNSLLAEAEADNSSFAAGKGNRRKSQGLSSTPKQHRSSSTWVFKVSFFLSFLLPALNVVVYFLEAFHVMSTQMPVHLYFNRQIFPYLFITLIGYVYPTLWNLSICIYGTIVAELSHCYERLTEKIREFDQQYTAFDDQQQQQSPLSAEPGGQTEGMPLPFWDEEAGPSSQFSNGRSQQESGGILSTRALLDWTIERYEYLRMVVDLVNETYSVYTVILYVFNMPNLVFLAYICTMDPDAVLSTKLLTGMWFLAYFYQLLVLSSASLLYSNGSPAIWDLLRGRLMKFVHPYGDGERERAGMSWAEQLSLKADLNGFLRILETDPVGIKVGSFGIIAPNMLLTVTSLALTYFFILIQFTTPPTTPQTFLQLDPVQLQNLTSRLWQNITTSI